MGKLGSGRDYLHSTVVQYIKIKIRISDGSSRNIFFVWRQLKHVHKMNFNFSILFLYFLCALFVLTKHKWVEYDILKPDNKKLFSDMSLGFVFYATHSRLPAYFLVATQGKQLQF